MEIKKFKHLNVDENGKIKDGGAVGTTGGISMSPKEGGCGSEHCKCSEGHWICVSLPRTKDGVVEGITVHMNEEEMSNFLHKNYEQYKFLGKKKSEEVLLKSLNRAKEIRSKQTKETKLLGEKVLKEVIDNVLEKSDKELYDIETREELQKKYFQFDFDEKYENSSRRLRDFVDRINLFKSFATDWEHKNYGFCCSVDRVYQHYITPLCKKFEETRNIVKNLDDNLEFQIGMNVILKEEKYVIRRVTKNSLMVSRVGSTIIACTKEKKHFEVAE